MCNSGMGGQGNSYAQPGFLPGGPNDPALGGSGYQTYPNRPPMGNPIGYNPPVQNPGMPSFPNGPGNMINNPIFQPIGGNGGFQPPVQNPGMAMPGTGVSLIEGGNPFVGADMINVPNPGMPPAGGGFKPPVQNPGTLIDGGPQGRPYNPQGAFQNLAKGTMPSMKRFVQAGKMGQAKKAFEAGGGTWNKSVHRRLKNKYGTGN